jgi:hypothetical protein
MRRHSLVCRFNAADRDRVTILEPASLVTEIPFVSGENRFDYGLGAILERMTNLGLRPSESAFDLALLATMVFCADTRISRQGDSQDGWTREIDLYVPVQNVSLWTAQHSLLERALHFLTGDQWRMFFRQRPEGFEEIVPRQQQEFMRFSCASLFSGGLDSYIGAIDLLESGERPLFVSHYIDGLTNQHQEICTAHLKRTYPQVDFEALRTYVCFSKDLIADSDGEFSQRARSFLFFGLGALAASGLVDGVTLYAPENGFIALNVPLDPLRLGALSTRTTHPFYMARINELLGRVGIHANLTNPYRHVTKGAMAAHCKNPNLLRATAKDTMSCSSPAKGRWKKQRPGHCGYCVPCLIRRGALSRGLGSDDTYYQLADLRANALNAGAADGQHIRSFQLALARLQSHPNSARAAIHSPGPLTDVHDEWTALAQVYSNGLQEVAPIIQGVVVRSK